MKVLSDSLSVLSDNWALVLVILLIILCGQMVIHLALKRIFGKVLTAEEYFSLGIGGWLVPALLFSFAWFLWELLVSRQFGASIIFLFISIFIVTMILFFRSAKEITQDPKIILFVLFAILALSLFLRLAFVLPVLVGPVKRSGANPFVHRQNGAKPLTYPEASSDRTGIVC